MRQRKLTKRQQARVNKMRENKIQADKSSRVSKGLQWVNDNYRVIEDHTFTGLVIQNFGKRVLIQADSAQKEILNCSFRQNLGQLVAGDVVHWQKIVSNETSQEQASKLHQQSIQTNSQQDFQGIVIAVSQRENLLARPNFQGKSKVIAANIDQAFIITAPDIISKNSLDKMINIRLIDRYLVICENAGIHPIIVINKIDLFDDNLLRDLDQSLISYKKLNYEIFYTSVLDNSGVSSLKNMMDSKKSIFVGQSGMGKSSLLNAILPHVNAKIAEVSAASGKGKHTTSTARLYDLSEAGIEQGCIIDSPGIRELGLWKLDRAQIHQGFKEIKEASHHCQFRDCLHDNEPGCAVVAAIEANQISEERLVSYHQILSSLN